MPLYSVRHVTTYRYKRPVRFGEHRVLFRPRDSYDQRLIGATIEVDPSPRDVRWIHDVFGNCVAIVRPKGRAAVLRFETNIRVEHTPQTTPEFRIDDAALVYPFDYPPDELAELRNAIARQYDDDQGEVARWAQQFVTPGAPSDTGKLLMTLCYAIHESFSYERRTAPGTQPPVITLLKRKGTCRDFALLMMEAVRSLGLAARFVTGYIYVASRDGEATLGGGATHAWCQVYLPGAGWVEFDPTNGIVGNRDLIRVAVTRDPRQAIPLSGSYFGASADDLGMTVQVNVTSEPASKNSVARRERAPAGDVGGQNQ